MGAYAGRSGNRAIRAALRLALVLVIALASACQQPPREAIRFALAAAPVTLDPRFATDAVSARINRLIYRRLVEFDAAARPVPGLARWERLDPVHYRFHLGAGGRTFHDGSRLTARDVKATYDFILDPANGSPHRTALAQVLRVESLDDETVDFYLRRPDPLFPGYLVVGVLPARLIEAGHRFQERPVGSGPFAFVSRPEAGRLVLRRLADGQRFEFVRVPDPTVRVLKLVRGEVDLLQNDLPPELMVYLSRRPGIRVIQGRGSNFTYLGFNLQDPVTGKLAVRRAVAHAIDREAIIRHVLGGAARPAQALLPPDHWAGHPDLEGYAFAPQRARALLAQAGFGPDNPPRIVYKTSSDPFRVRLATIIQRHLERVGIQVDLRSHDWGTFYGDVKAGRFQMYSLSWVGIKTPDIFRYIFHSTSVPPAGANRGRFASPLADRLIEAAERAGDLEERAALYRRLQAHLLETLPYVPLWYEGHVSAARDDIEGYRLAPDGNYDALVHTYRVSR